MHTVTQKKGSAHDEAAGNSTRRFYWDPDSVAPRYRAAAWAGFAIAYAALVALGFGLRDQSNALVIIWPASGLLFVTLFFTPRRIWTGVLALQVVMQVLVEYLFSEHFQPFWSVMFAAADSLDALVGASIAVRLIRQVQLPRILQVVTFFGAAALGSATSALFGALCAVHVLTDANYLHQWQIWWAGNWLGSLAIAPMVLAWSVRLWLPELSVRELRVWELALTCAVLLGMTAWIFSAPPGDVTTFLQLPAMLLAILVIAAFRLPPRWSITLAVATVLLAARWSSYGLGPFSAEPNLFARIGSLQVFLATLLVFTFMLATILLEKQRAHRQLAMSEERHRHFLAHSSEAVWRVELKEPMPMGLPTDAQRAWLKEHAHIAECNLSYEHLQEASGLSGADLGQWRADVPWSAIYVEQLDLAARQGYSMDGLRFTLGAKASQEVYLTNFSGVVENGALVRVWGAARNITELSNLNERLRREQERLQAYARQLVGAEERARRTMAVSLQEGVDSQLAELNLTIDALSAKSPAGLRPLLDGLRITLNNVQEHTRRLIADVSPPGLYDIGLGAALQWLAIYVRGRDDLEVVLTVNVNEKLLLLEQRVLIFQVIRELLRNVARHARVGSAQVIVGHTGDELCVDVIDEGAGFDWQYDLFSDLSGGFGLFSIADRVRSADGRLTVDTAPGKGCRVTVHFPLAETLARTNRSRSVG